MGSSIHELGFESLAKLDGGKLNAVLAHHFSRAALDCEDRPGDAKPRQVTIKAYFTPVTQQDGYTSDYTLEAEIESKVPTHRSRKYSVGIRRKGNGAVFVFNEASLNNVSQNTLEYGEDD